MCGRLSQCPSSDLDDQRLIKAIGETTDYVNGPEYETMRPKQSDAYKAMVKALAGKESGLWGRGSVVVPAGVWVPPLSSG